MTERDIFLAVLDLPGSAARTTYLDRVCGRGSALCDRVEALLRSHETAGSFLGSPAVTPPGSAASATLAFSGEATPDDDANADDLTFLSPPGRPDSLGRIGHYDVLEVLGRGGFGIVFRAFDEVLQRVVAVKVLAPRMAATSPARKRFLREARLSAQVRHENIVQVYAVEEQPLPYLVMEFIPGETLQHRLDRTGPLEVSEVVTIGRQIAEGLAAAHDTGLIHRDIKPANILLEARAQQHVKITDFGLARAADDASITQSGVVAGTPMFMAPEQAKGEKLDHRADLFSLGSVLYTICSGRAPFRANSTFAVLKRVAEDTPRPIPEIIPEVPQWLCEIIAKLHAQNPDDRFASAREVADLLAGRQAEPQPIGSVRPVPKVEAPVAKTAPAVRCKRMLLAAAFVLLVVLGGMGVTEATGVTHMRGTVIRLFYPQGTLIVEVDDPAVTVVIDGEDMVITGAGVKEVRLKPGQYKVEASKDGKLVSQALVTVTNNGRQVVRISRESVAATAAKLAPTPGTKPAIGASEWEKALAALPVEEQVRAVVVRLNDLNPGFESFDLTVTHVIEGETVTQLRLVTDNLTDISPVRALTGLDTLKCPGSGPGRGKLKDLSPLKDMKLTTLICPNNRLADLSSLKAMRLQYLDFYGSSVTDLSPLKQMPLRFLVCARTNVADLSPLKGVRLKYLDCGDTKVTDLSPLKDTQLSGLRCSGVSVANFSDLKGLPLKELVLDFLPERDAEVLRTIKTLETINHTAVAEFWKTVGQK